MSINDHQDLNQMIIEYLKANGMPKVADSMISEINSTFIYIG